MGYTCHTEGLSEVDDNHLADSSDSRAVLQSMWQYAAISFLLHEAHRLLSVPCLSLAQLENVLVDPESCVDHPPYSTFLQKIPSSVLSLREDITLQERCKSLYEYLDERLSEEDVDLRWEPCGIDHSGYLYYDLGLDAVGFCRESFDQRTWEFVAQDAAALEAFISSGELSERRKTDKDLLRYIQDEMLPHWRVLQKRLDKQRALELLPRKRSSRLADIEEQRRRAEEEEKERRMRELEERSRILKEREQQRAMEMEAEQESVREVTEMDRMQRRNLEREQRRLLLEERKIITEYEKAMKIINRFEEDYDAETKALRWKQLRELRRQFDEDIEVPDDLSDEEWTPDYVYPPIEERQELRFRMPPQKVLVRIAAEKKMESKLRREQEKQQRLQEILERPRTAALVAHEIMNEKSKTPKRKKERPLDTDEKEPKRKYRKSADKSGEKSVAKPGENGDEEGPKRKVKYPGIPRMMTVTFSVMSTADDDYIKIRIKRKDYYQSKKASRIARDAAAGEKTGDAGGSSQSLSASLLPPAPSNEPVLVGERTSNSFDEHCLDGSYADHGRSMEQRMTLSDDGEVAADRHGSSVVDSSASDEDDDQRVNM
eukprot:ANDGO_01576.mRNA.1 hypothetical protein